MANQYNQRVTIFPKDTTYEVMVDVGGQSWTQEMLSDIKNKISTLTNGNVTVNFMY